MEVLNIKGVNEVVGDQCRYGLVAKGDEGYGPARKTTRFMTKSQCIALQLRRMCPNKGGHQIHKHEQLDGGRAKAAQLYPPELCRAVCQGLMGQVDADGNGQYLLMNVEQHTERSSRN